MLRATASRTKRAKLGRCRRPLNGRMANGSTRTASAKAPCVSPRARRYFTESRARTICDPHLRCIEGRLRDNGLICPFLDRAIVPNPARVERVHQDLSRCRDGHLPVPRLVSEVGSQGSDLTKTAPFRSIGFEQPGHDPRGLGIGHKIHALSRPTWRVDVAVRGDAPSGSTPSRSVPGDPA